MVFNVVNGYMGLILSSPFVKAYAFVSRRIVFVHSLIRYVLAIGGPPKIIALIIKTISILMIHQDAIRGSSEDALRRSLVAGGKRPAPYRYWRHCAVRRAAR